MPKLQTSDTNCLRTFLLRCASDFWNVICSNWVHHSASSPHHTTSNPLLPTASHFRPWPCHSTPHRVRNLLPASLPSLPNTSGQNVINWFPCIAWVHPPGFTWPSTMLQCATHFWTYSSQYTTHSEAKMNSISSWPDWGWSKLIRASPRNKAVLDIHLHTFLQLHPFWRNSDWPLLST